MHLKAHITITCSHCHSSVPVVCILMVENSRLRTLLCIRKYFEGTCSGLIQEKMLLTSCIKDQIQSKDRSIKDYLYSEDEVS